MQCEWNQWNVFCVRQAGHSNTESTQNTDLVLNIEESAVLWFVFQAVNAEYFRSGLLVDFAVLFILTCQSETFCKQCHSSEFLQISKYVYNMK